MEQLNLTFEAGISKKHRSLQQCCAAWVYRIGFGEIVFDINSSPGNLSNMLSEDNARKFGVDDMEKVLDAHKDFEPIFYLIDKYLKNQATLNNTNLINQAATLMSQFKDVVEQLQDTKAVVKT